MKNKKKSLFYVRQKFGRIDSWGRFHQHFRAIFSRAKFDAFFGERRLANGTQIWRIFRLKFGFTVLELTVGEIEWRIFRQTRCAGIFSLGEKV